MIIDKIGDILHTEADVICHQVNCKGVMGAGLAKQIRKKNNTELTRKSVGNMAVQILVK